MKALGFELLFCSLVGKSQGFFWKLESLNTPKFVCWVHFFVFVITRAHTPDNQRVGFQIS